MLMNPSFLDRTAPGDNESYAVLANLQISILEVGRYRLWGDFHVMFWAAFLADVLALVIPGYGLGLSFQLWIAKKPR